MKKQIISIIILSLLIVFNACGIMDNDKKEEAKKKRQQIEENTEKAKLRLQQKYNSIVLTDEQLEKNFTYVLQEMIIDKKRTLFLEGSIHDIYKSDSSYILEMYGPYNYYDEVNLVALITISKEQLINLEKQMANDRKKGAFIINTTAISPSRPMIDYSISDSESKEDAYLTDLYLGYTKCYKVYKGDLIDFYLEEKMEYSIL